MKKLNNLVGLFGIFFALLICVQLLILTTYSNYIDEFNMNLTSSIIIGPCFLVSGMLLVFEKNYKNNALLDIALFLFLSSGIISIFTINSFTHHKIYALLSFSFLALVGVNRIYIMNKRKH